jgi:ankyrin repeat protein
VLLEASVGVDAHDERGRTPLMLAAERGHVETMRVLMEAGAALDARDVGKRRWPALMHALHADCATAALALLEWGADPDACEDSGYSALMMAASRGDRWVVDELLSRGASPTTELFLGFTALDYAIGYGHTGVVRRLLDAAPQLRKRHNPARRAVLALADSAGEKEILELLSAR